MIMMVVIVVVVDSRRRGRGADYGVQRKGEVLGVIKRSDNGGGERVDIGGVKVGGDRKPCDSG